MNKEIIGFAYSAVSRASHGSRSVPAIYSQVAICENPTQMRNARQIEIVSRKIKEQKNPGVLKTPGLFLLTQISRINKIIIGRRMRIPFMILSIATLNSFRQILFSKYSLKLFFCTNFKPASFLFLRMDVFQDYLF